MVSRITVVLSDKERSLVDSLREKYSFLTTDTAVFRYCLFQQCNRENKESMKLQELFDVIE